MLLLAGILAATLRLSLGSRQNVGDQKATLQAQYAAESGVSLARSRLQDIQDMLTYTPARLSSDGSVPALQLARNIKVSALQGWMSSLCGGTPWTPIFEGKATNDPGYFDSGPSSTTDKDDALYPAAQACVPAAYTSASQLILFSKIVTDAAYSIWPVSERPDLNDSAKQTFWYNMFTQKVTSTSDIATVSTTPKILRILRLTTSRYRIFIQNPGTTAASIKTGDIQRKLSGQASKSGTWWFDVNQPALLDAVVQTDYQTSVNGSKINFTTSTNFEGPLKTNDVFSFDSSAGNDSPSFSGQLSSAGCTDRIVTTELATCTRNPGVKVDSDTAKRDFVGNTDSVKSTAIQNYISNNGVDINYNGVTPNYSSDYQPFPEAALIQEAAANGKDENGNPLPNGQRGFTLNSAQEGVQLFAGNENGDPLSINNYDTNNDKWNEPTPTYQYIKPITKSTCTNIIVVTGCTYEYDTTIYRIDKDNNIQEKVGRGAWTTRSGEKFNGVVYKSGAMTVVGPQPGRGDYISVPPEEKALPAIASFSGITLAATNDVTVRSDLALSETPCRYSQYASLQLNPPCNKRENVLGVFSSEGSVIVGKQVPNNAVLQAAVMSSKKEITVEDYSTGDPRGALRFTGSMVEKYYGGNGTYGTRCVARDRRGNCISIEPFRSGYTRDYSYDKRFADGLTPPFYPTSPKWTFTDASNRDSDLSDILWSQGSK